MFIFQKMFIPLKTIKLSKGNTSIFRKDNRRFLRAGQIHLQTSDHRMRFWTKKII